MAKTSTKVDRRRPASRKMDAPAPGRSAVLLFGDLTREHRVMASMLKDMPESTDLHGRLHVLRSSLARMAEAVDLLIDAEGAGR